MTDKQFEAIESIMDNFDFDKVQKVMEFLNWKWVSTENGIPSVQELRSQARRLIKEAIEEKVRIATGGFRVDYFYEDEGYVELSFIVDQWSSEI